MSRLAAGVTTHYCLVTVDIGHVPRDTTSHLPNTYYQLPTHRFMRALRSIPLPHLVLPRLVSRCFLGYTYSARSM